MMLPHVAWMSPVVRQMSAETSPVATHSPVVVVVVCMHDDVKLKVMKFQQSTVASHVSRMLCKLKSRESDSKGPKGEADLEEVEYM